MDWSHINTWLYGLFMLLVSGVIFVTRIVFTNQTQIKLLEQQINYRIEQDAKLDNQLLELRSDVKALMQRK